jgi:hypothetical protein
VPGSGTSDGPADDEHWFVINGRRWRRTDPELPEDVVQRLKSHLGSARATVGAASRRGDEDAVAAARSRVGIAKHGLGERGPKWWEEPLPDRVDRARQALEELDAPPDGS